VIWIEFFCNVLKLIPNRNLIAEESFTGIEGFNFLTGLLDGIAEGSNFGVFLFDIIRSTVRVVLLDVMEFLLNFDNGVLKCIFLLFERVTELRFTYLICPVTLHCSFKYWRWLCLEHEELFHANFFLSVAVLLHDFKEASNAIHFDSYFSKIDFVWFDLCFQSYQFLLIRRCFLKFIADFFISLLDPLFCKIKQCKSLKTMSCMSKRAF